MRKPKVRQYTIYKVSNSINQKLYIGLSKNFEYRKRAHYNAIRTGKNQYVIHRAMIKYGVENFKFDIVEQWIVDEPNLTKEEIKAEYKKLKEREKFYIAEWNTLAPNGYNITKGGDGTVGYKRPAESCARISEKRKGKFGGDKNSFYGKAHTIEAKQQMSDSKKLSWENGAYKESSLLHRLFTSEEEKVIVNDCINNPTMTSKAVANKYNCSITTIQKLVKKHNIILFRLPKTEEHKKKMKANIEVARKEMIQAVKEKSNAMIAKIIPLREQGMLQKEIAIVLDIAQTRVSQLLLRAGFRTMKTKRTKK